MNKKIQIIDDIGDSLMVISRELKNTQMKYRTAKNVDHTIHYIMELLDGLGDSINIDETNKTTPLKDGLKSFLNEN